MTSTLSNSITAPSSPSLGLGGRRPSTIAPADSISAAPSLASRSPSATSSFSLHQSDKHNAKAQASANGLSEVDQLFIRLNEKLEAAGAVSGVSGLPPVTIWVRSADLTSVSRLALTGVLRA